ncbi:MAG: hypothetical protein IKC13_02885, partial [Elusimicrobiaceae bacterium]|nr:hypothetical protein [Elusimicrobiaceae bacterium]
HIASIGAGYSQDRWTLDVYYAHIFAQDLSGTSAQLGKSTGTPVPMKYTDGKSEMFGFTFGYKF